MSMDTESILQVFMAALAISSGLLGRVANEEATPRNGALASFWWLEPEQLTAKGKVYRKWFLANLGVFLIVFFTWLVLYH